MVSKNIEDFSVVIRCHPPRSRDPEEQTKMAVSIDSSQNLIKLKDPNPDKQSEPSQEFSFERIYDWNSGQKDFFDQVAKPLIQDVLEGYNGTILAHGQTGSGKTYTIQGNLAEKDQYGIIPRAAEEIFKSIEANTSKDKQYFVYCSFIMIYNEVINDLLSPSPSAKLLLKERPEREVYIKGVNLCRVKNSEELLQLYLKGLKSRDILVTKMSLLASRCYLIFKIRQESFELNSEGKVVIRASSLHLVDMAGSERPSKTSVDYEVATKISVSLSPLGNVISALTDPKHAHVPYRDSKITRILQESLGGNAKTVWIATVIPDITHLDETTSTLRYASRAKNIKNVARINYRDSLLEEIQSELETLKAELRPSNVINQLGNQIQLDNQLNPNENELMMEEESKDYQTREKENIEKIIDSTMKTIQRIEALVDEQKNEVWKSLKEKEKECHKVIERRVLVEEAILSLKSK